MGGRLILKVLLLFLLPISVFYLMFTIINSSNKVGVSTDRSELNTITIHTEELTLSSKEGKFIPLQNQSCWFDTCFDLSRCEFNKLSLIKVYVYPPNTFIFDNHDHTQIEFNTSLPYDIIMSAIKNSRYSTDKPSEACLFISNLDSLIDSDQNSLLLSLALTHLPFWDSGRNHLMFSFLPSSPASKPSISYQEAMIAAPGLVNFEYRIGFDVSIPLYNFPARLDQFPENPQNIARETHLLILMAPEFDTALESTIEIINSKMGNRIKVVEFCQNELRCIEDNVIQYPEILLTSKYCLILPGYRYITPDWLDVLMSGCVLVYVNAGYMLPFEEVLDWNLAAISVRPAFLERLHEILDSLSSEEWKSKQLQSLKLWRHYFSSLEDITITTLDIINDRVFSLQTRSYHEWNLIPEDTPFYNSLSMLPVPAADKGFTAIILTHNRIEQLHQLINTLIKVPSTKMIIIIWNNPKTTPPKLSISSNIEIITIKSEDNKLTNRFLPLPDSKLMTQCILSLDDDMIMLTEDEIEFGYQCWREFPDRLVGFPGRYHEWSEIDLGWVYISEWMSEISLVLTGAAFYHHHYHTLFFSKLPEEIISWVDHNMNCEDIAMNFLIANYTDKAPIKVTPRKKFSCTTCQSSDNLSKGSLSQINNYYDMRSYCLNYFARVFNKMPLKVSDFRLDPLLFKTSGKYSKYTKIGEL